MKNNEIAMEMRYKTMPWRGLAVGLSSLLLVAGVVSCGRSSLELDPQGMPVRFGAATTWQNDIQTRTEYSGFDENGNFVTSSSKYERIDWVADHDRIRILCAEALGPDGTTNSQGDYVMGAPTANGKMSEAGATLAEGSSEFYWAKDVAHSFYALYPAPGTTSNYHDGSVSAAESAITLDGSGAVITGGIPAGQTAVKKSGTTTVGGQSYIKYMPNMNLSYMYAQKRTVRTDGGYVLLDFLPLVTTFEFSLKALDDAMALYDLVSVSLTSTSTDLNGNFTVALDATPGAAAPVVEKAFTPAAANKTVTVTLPSGTRLTKTDYSVVTIIALGVAQTDLTLKLNFSNGHSRTRLLKKSDGTVISVGACKKAYFKLGVPGDEIFFQVDPMATDPFDGENPIYQAVTRGLDPIDNSIDRGIIPQRFGVYAVRNAEGVDFDPVNNPMNLYLNRHDVEYLETLADDDTYWRGSPSAYWPSFDRLNFFTYAPYRVAVPQAGSTEPDLQFPSSDYVKGMPRATYTPAANVTNQVDLCISRPALNLNYTKENTPIVPLAFKHALTRIRLFVRVKGTRLPQYVYRVTKINLSGLVGTNTFTYQDNATTPFVWDAITASTPHDAGYSLTYSATELTSSWVTFIGDPAGDGITDSYTWVNAPVNGRLYLLPQPITEAAEMEIVISMYKESGVSASLQSVLPSFLMHLPTDTAWEPGKTVSYLITVDATNMVILDIDAKVDEWDSAGNTHDELIIF